MSKVLISTGEKLSYISVEPSFRKRISNEMLEKAIQMKKDGFSLSSIAKELGIMVQTLHQSFKKRGVITTEGFLLPNNDGLKMAHQANIVRSAFRREKVKELSEQGIGVDEIANTVKLSIARVQQLQKELGLFTPSNKGRKKYAKSVPQGRKTLGFRKEILDVFQSKVGDYIRLKSEGKKLPEIYQELFVGKISLATFYRIVKSL